PDRRPLPRRPERGVHRRTHAPPAAPASGTAPRRTRRGGARRRRAHPHPAPPPPPHHRSTTMPPTLADTLRRRLIVSCQAPPGDPMRHTDTLVRMALAARAGGAAAVRVNDPEVVAATVAAVDLPVIGLWKDGDSGVFITPTVRHALALVDAGAAVVA